MIIITVAYIVAEHDLIYAWRKTVENLVPGLVCKTMSHELVLLHMLLLFLLQVGLAAKYIFCVRKLTTESQPV